MSILRVAKRRRYTTVSNVPLEDSSLSMGAKGLLVYLLSKPDDWTVNRAHLETVGPDGQHRIRRFLAELEAGRYLVRSRVHGEDGRFTWEILIHEEPQPLVEKPLVDYPPMGNPPVENRPPTKDSVPRTETPKTEKENDDDVVGLEDQLFEALCLFRRVRPALLSKREVEATRMGVREVLVHCPGVTPEAVLTLSGQWWSEMAAQKQRTGGSVVRPTVPQAWRYVAENFVLAAPSPAIDYFADDWQEQLARVKGGG